MDVEIPEVDNDTFVGVYYGQSKKGFAPYNAHKVNQDCMLVKEDTNTGTLILGAFDGHGQHGQCVSEFVCSSFYNFLIDHPKYKTQLKEAAVDALACAEHDCLENHLIRTEFSGTTAVICIIRGHYFLTLNVGDSRAILASNSGDHLHVQSITQDHKPSLPEERKRIEGSGGRVFALSYDDGYTGPERVWLKDQDIPGLAMSRSLGDTVAHSVGVVSTPDVFERTLTDDDRMIVLGSDGLWEFISSEEVVRIIQDCRSPQEAVERLGSVSWDRWFNEEKVVDDTTIIVVFLGKMSVQ